RPRAEAFRIRHDPVINDEALRNRVDDLALHGDLVQVRLVQGAADVGARDAALGVGDGHLTVGLLTLDVATGDADQHVANGVLGNFLRLAHGGADGVDRLLQVHDDAAAQSLARRASHAADGRPARGVNLADDRADLCRTDVQTREDARARRRTETSPVHAHAVVAHVIDACGVRRPVTRHGARTWC